MVERCGWVRVERLIVYEHRNQGVNEMNRVLTLVLTLSCHSGHALEVNMDNLAMKSRTGR